MGLNFESKSFKEGRKFILIGFFLISVSMLFHKLHIVDNPSEFQIFLNDLSIQFFSHFGIGSLAIGILSIMLDMNHWTNYFETRLSNIVMKKEYLKSLKKEDLALLEKDLLRVYFNDSEDVEIKESFLSYYQKNIQKFIGMPYRKNVVMHLTITEKKIKPVGRETELELFEISEIITYKCKKNGEHLQENICYIPEEFEHYSTDSFYVKLQHKDLSKKKGANKQNELIFNHEKLKELEAIKDGNIGFDLNIKEYITDELNVTVKAVYKIRKDRFFGWRMSHPTLDLTLIVDYPVEYIIAKEFYFSEDNSFTFENDPERGSFYLKNSEWLLPDEGLTLQLTKNE